MKGEIITNPFIGSLIKVVKSFNGNIMDSCMLTGNIQVSNVSLVNSAVISLWPSGDYKIISKLYDDIDDNIYSLIIYCTIIH